MVDLDSLEGWLIKEKSRGSKFGLDSITGDSNRRWFRVQRMHDEGGGDENKGELALCYFKSRSDRQFRGWIYLRDVNEIAEEHDIIVIVSPARTLRLQAPTRPEHRLWITGLVELC
ncbi:unnamed protein product, partial [Phaeothamnion confervicola]